MPEQKNAPPDAPTGVRKEEDIEAPDREFAFVRISEFYSPRKVVFDLYLRLGEGKYLRIFRAGETFEEPDLKAYETERGMRTVFFKREHRAAYLTSSLALLERISALPGVPLRTKFGVARILAELFIHSFFEADDKTRRALLDQGKNICFAIATWVDQQAGLDKYLFHLDQIDANAPALSFLIGLSSCLLANRMPWKSRRTNETLLLASFLADVGQTALPEEVVRLKLKRMTVPQKRQFEKHPEISYFLLNDLGSPVLNENVLTIVRQHHEYCDATGYPKALTGDKTLMLSKVVVLCGDMVRTASDFLLPIGDTAKMIFPDFTEKLFKERPELVAKYERELLPPLFKMLKEGGF